MASKVCTVLLAALGLVSADVYLHHPRGANDRCDEKSNNRNNQERLYDTENNAAGGYGWCDKEMIFYEGTYLDISWYSQHSCGNGQMSKQDPHNPESTICQHVLQLGCEDKFRQFAGKEHETYKLTDGISLGRPGADRPSEIADDPLEVYNTFGTTCTETAPTWDECDAAAITAANNACKDLEIENNRGTFNGDTCKCSDRKRKTYGYHEPEHWWRMCKARDRNSGLFTATQNVQDNAGATKTRQEPNSARYGFECTEERDYWPYWHPTPWIDLAVYTSDDSACEFFRTESQNGKEKCHCMAKDIGLEDYNEQDTEASYEAYKYNQKVPCESAGHQWVCFGNWELTLPHCDFAPAQTDNRLGNPSNKGQSQPDEYDGDIFATHRWLINDEIIPEDQDEVKCVIRLRYNISTFETGKEFDQTDNKKIQQNPVHTIGKAFLGATASEGYTPGKVADHMPIRMAINTAQFGRTFEDRTQVFRVARRPPELRSKTIHNLNVRGKRGNIAQVRNCVEYDFVPYTLNVRVGDFVHFQWCGTDYNDNGNAGEGRAGTDRNNVVAIPNFQANLPSSLNATTTIFDEEDLRELAWLGQKDSDCFSVQDMLDTQKNNQNDPKSCHFLNGVRDPERPSMPTAYYSKLVQVKRSGTFMYMNSRNNNFSNRSQKAVITTEGSALTMGAKIGIGIGVGLGVLLIVVVVAIALLVSAGKMSLPKFSSRV